MTNSIWLVRHAPTERTGRAWTGWRSDPPLSAEGRRVAVNLAANLARRVPSGTAVVSSPADRAVTTAEGIAARVGGRVEVDRDLQEVDVGDADGLSFDELAAAHPALAARLLAAAAVVDWPGGERSADFRRRAAAAWRRIVEREDDAAVIVVTHGGVIGPLLALALPSDAAADRERWLAAGGAISVERRDGAWWLGDRLAPGSGE